MGLSTGTTPILGIWIVMLVGFVTAAFVPAVRRRVPRPLEAVLWLAFIATAFLAVLDFSDLKATDATASLIWGALGLAGIELASGLEIAAHWLTDHRFAIADWLVIVAGADVLVLILARAFRSGARTAPRIHLGEWLEMPRTAIVVAEEVSDPFAGVNRRLAAATARGLHSVAQALTTHVVRPVAIGAVHVLGPGRARLGLVKMALRIDQPQPRTRSSPRPATASPKGSRGNDLEPPRRIGSPRHSRTSGRGSGRVIDLNPATAPPTMPALKSRPAATPLSKKRNDVVPSHRSSRLAS